MDACLQCGKPFVRIHARKRKYCSDSCKALACTARAKADGRADKWRAATSERKRRRPDKVKCPQCGETFMRQHGNRKYCSPRCRNRAYYESSYPTPARKSQLSDSAKRRRARKRGAGAEVFTSVEIYERDHWRCQLCGVLVDRSVKVPAWLAPTIDHVVPLAAGGQHALTNVQTAHFICNSRKSDRYDPEVISDAGTGSEASLNAGAA